MEDFSSYFQKFVSSSNNMELLGTLSHEVLNHQPLISTSHHADGVVDYASGLHFSDDAPPHQPLFCSLDQGNNAHLPPSLPSIQGDQFQEIPSSPGFGSDKSSGMIARKRKRKNEGEQQVLKPREVVHVRAKRGQATDSHSLAERVRRERINEKLRVLQDLVPGCYKTMGMAVMLDVIINYVRSLQNQIEFLSMKLSAASLFYDFNSPEAEALESLQRTTNSCEGNEMKRMAGGGNSGSGGTPPRVQLQSTWPF